MIKITASHPDYEELNYLYYLLNQLCNPGMWIGQMDMDEHEIEDMKQTILKEIEYLIQPTYEVFENLIRDIEEGVEDDNGKCS